MAGIIGEQARREAQRLAEQRADELVREREERWKAERSRQDVLAKARSGDYYAIGEQAARDREGRAHGPPRTRAEAVTPTAADPAAASPCVRSLNC